MLKQRAGVMATTNKVTSACPFDASGCLKDESTWFFFTGRLTRPSSLLLLLLSSMMSQLMFTDYSWVLFSIHTHTHTLTEVWPVWLHKSEWHHRLHIQTNTHTRWESIINKCIDSTLRVVCWMITLTSMMSLNPVMSLMCSKSRSDRHRTETTHSASLFVFLNATQASCLC